MQVVGDPMRVETGTEGVARILVVEGDQGIRRTIGAVLRHDGYEIALARTADEALDRLRAERYDMLLLDARAGRGVEDVVTRAHAIDPTLATIVLARFATLEAALRALHAGAYGYLMKPLDVEELRASLRRGLDHRQLEREVAERARELETAHNQVRALDLEVQRQLDDATALRDKVEALDETNRQLLHAQEEHDRFIAMVAHEMRGPLNPIINYAQLAKRTNLASDLRDHYMDVIVEHAFRLNRLVDDLQTATRLSTGQFALRRESCDVVAVVSEVTDSFAATVRERRFSLDGPEDPIMAEVDRDRVVQAVRNLVDNAVKYSGEGTAVDVRVWQDSQNAYIRVQDQGAGIPEAEMQHIFEAFTRLNKAADVAGSGLGLYITRGIVAAHGGSLAVENGTGSERARGAIFTIQLPLHAPDEGSAGL
jgi:signal transduction histidine kinase